MRLRITMHLDNDAFQGEGGLDDWAIADRLREIARDIDYRGDRAGVVRDLNGNRVGHWSIE